MSKPGLSFGLNLAKKPGQSKPAPAKRKPMFGGEDDSDDDNTNTKGAASGATSISELDDDFTSHSAGSKSAGKKPSHKSKAAPPTEPPNSKSKKNQLSMYGDLSSSLESRRHREAAEELDPSIYDYDGVYDSLKPAKEKDKSAEDAERRPKYMKNLIASAAVRKRDALIAEEKKIAREREEEGDEFADKEKFVTEAYKAQQAENRRLEEEERLREEREARENKAGGMTAFYKDLLDRGDRRHAEVVQAAAERARAGPPPPAQGEEEEGEKKEKTETDRAREINKEGGAIAINEDGQVVDKRELLKGGLNLSAVKKKKPGDARGDANRDDDAGSNRRGGRDQGRGFVGQGGGKQAMRERQSRMLEAQLEQALKRSLEDEEEERQKTERASKSRKTEQDVSSAKERYLARKREAEEAKRKAAAG